MVTPGTIGSPQTAGIVNWYLPDNQRHGPDVAVQRRDERGRSCRLHTFGQITSHTSLLPADQPTSTYDGLWQDPWTGLIRPPSAGRTPWTTFS